MKTTVEQIRVNWRDENGLEEPPGHIVNVMIPIFSKDTKSIEQWNLCSKINGEWHLFVKDSPIKYPVKCWAGWSLLFGKSTEDNNPFLEELRGLINRFSQENQSNTPDFILANYLLNCMAALNNTIKSRDGWYNINPHPGIS